MRESLSNYGYDFQVKVISCLMTDSIFTSRVFDLLKPSYFESSSIRELCSIALTYFKEYRALPTLAAFKVSIENEEDELLKQEMISALRQAVTNADSTDLEFIKEQTLDYCKYQELKRAILESADDLKHGNYDDIRTKIENALKVGMDNNIGLQFSTSAVASRYDEEARNVISTGISVLDDLLKGGLAQGELGVIIAPSGAGKSWLLAILGANAKRLDKTVLHYTLELSETYVGRRYDCILTGIKFDKLADNTNEIERSLSKIPGDLIIKEFPTKGISLMGIEAHISKLKMLGIKPDLVIIDYPELLRFGNSRDAQHISIGELYEEVRGLASSQQVPIWAVSQSNREGMNTDIIEADKAAGSYAKIFTADFVASLSRKAQDKLSDTARLHIIKNRFGPDGMTFPCIFKPEKGFIDVQMARTTEGKATSKQMQSDSQYRKSALLKRYHDLNDNDDGNNLF